jgi:hypothetical protein
LPADLADRLGSFSIDQAITNRAAALEPPPNP